jgi:DNA-binding CsgD family transcriptional regulator
MIREAITVRVGDNQTQDLIPRAAIEASALPMWVDERVVVTDDVGFKGGYLLIIVPRGAPRACRDIIATAQSPHVLAVLDDVSTIPSVLPLVRPGIVLISNGVLKAAASTLTLRQCEVLDLVRRGCTNAEIATQLFLSIATVKRELGAMCKMFGASNRVQLALASVGHG